MSRRVLFKVGITVFFALIALIWGVSFLKGKGEFIKESTYYAIYDGVGGLEESNVVILNGYKIGQVKTVSFLPDATGRLLVEFTANSKVLMPRGTQAKIYSYNLMGTKAIQIVLGQGKEIHQSGDTLIPVFEGGLQEMVNEQVLPLKVHVEDLMTELEETVAAVNTIFDEEHTHKLKQGIVNLSETSADLKEMVAQNKDNLNTTLQHLNEVSAMLAQNQHHMANIIENTSTLSDSLQEADIKAAIDHSAELLSQLSDLTHQINKGEGSLGKLMKQDSLYENLNRTVQDFDSLLVDLKANPSRYVQVSVFGKKN